MASRHLNYFQLDEICLLNYFAFMKYINKRGTLDSDLR